MSLLNLIRLVMFIVALQAARRFNPIPVVFIVCAVGFLAKTYGLFSILFEYSVLLEIRWNSFSNWMGHWLWTVLPFDLLASSVGALIGWAVSPQRQRASSKRNTPSQN